MVIRPHGTLYLLYSTLKFSLSFGLSIALIIFSIVDNSFAFIWLLIFPLFWGVLQLRDFSRYKIVITDNSIWMAANKDIGLIRHQDITIKLMNLKTIQFELFMTYTLVSKITLTYENNKKYLNVMRFSKKQIEKIMSIIKMNAEKYNGYEIKILPSLIQGKIENEI